MKDIMKFANEYADKLKIIDINYLEKFLYNLKEFEIERKSPYNEGYYDGFQKAIDLLSDGLRININ